MDIINVLFSVRDKGQPRLVKHCDPALKHLKETFPDTQLRDKAIQAFEKEAASSEEESKEQDEPDKQAIEAKVDRVLQALEPKKKKANQSSAFRQLKRVGLRKMNEEHKKDEDTSVEVVTKEVKTLKEEAEQG